MPGEVRQKVTKCPFFSIKGHSGSVQVVCHKTKGWQDAG